jgi:NitT/TauT family transport system substrate-binding protein/sulfonate transport system substrate-binding protein
MVVEMRAAPDAFYKFLQTTSKLSPAALREQYPLDLWDTDPVPTYALENLEVTKRFFLEQRFIRRDFSIAEWILPDIYRGLAQPANRLRKEPLK